MMINSSLIFFGAGIGGVLRFWLSRLVYNLSGSMFPLGTLTVNALGSFFMGLFFVLFIERINGFSPYFRSLILIGLLGGFTTFSSFSIETLQLFEQGQWLNAILNIMLSIVLCLFMVWLGVWGGRQL